MQFRDLRRQYEMMSPALDAALKEVASEGRYIMGLQVAELEQRLANRVGVSHCISCANGTDALRLALMVWNIGVGDAVFVPDFTFFASCEVILSVGATPVFVDVDAHTYNMDASDLQKKIEHVQSQRTLNPKAVIAVNLFGLPANYPALRLLTDHYGLLLLEDGAQGFGGRLNGQEACSFGDISTTSFFPAKPLGCWGDGGAVFTNNADWASRIRSLCQHGKGSNKYENIFVGLNSRLDTIQAAILLVKLNFFEQELNAVDKAAKRYSQWLASWVQIPIVENHYSSAWAQYTIVLADEQQRDALKSFLQSRDIPSMIYYPKAMHQQPVIDVPSADCPVATSLVQRVLSLPMHPYIKDDEIDFVASSVISFLKGGQPC